MQEVIVVKPETTDEELKEVLDHCAINPQLAVVITRPFDLTLAQKFDCDIVTLWNFPFSRAYEVATIVSEQSDALIVVIGCKDGEKDADLSSDQHG